MLGCVGRVWPCMCKTGGSDSASLDSGCSCMRTTAALRCVLLLCVHLHGCVCLQPEMNVCAQRFINDGLALAEVRVSNVTALATRMLFVLSSLPCAPLTGHS
jgi:hypothetical protein